MADLLDKHFEIMVLEMFKELRENMEKVKRIIYEQNGNNKKEVANLRKKTQKDILQLKSITKTKTH